jgi:hypothetical protein
VSLSNARLMEMEEQLAALVAGTGTTPMSDVHLYVHLIGGAEGPSAEQAETKALLLTLLTKGDILMATLDEMVAAASASSTKVDSLIALQVAQKAALDEALKGITLSPEQQAKVDAVFAIDTGDAAKVQAALDANVAPVVEPPAA